MSSYAICLFSIHNIIYINNNILQIISALTIAHMLDQPCRDRRVLHSARARQYPFQKRNDERVKDYGCFRCTYCDHKRSCKQELHSAQRVSYVPNKSSVPSGQTALPGVSQPWWVYVCVLGISWLEVHEPAMEKRYLQ